MKTRKSYGATNFATTAMLSLLVVSIHIAGFELLAANDVELASQTSQSYASSHSQNANPQTIETIVVTATRCIRYFPAI